MKVLYKICLISKVGGSKDTLTPLIQKMGGPDPLDPHQVTPLQVARSIATHRNHCSCVMKIRR